MLSIKQKYIITACVSVICIVLLVLLVVFIAKHRNIQPRFSPELSIPINNITIIQLQDFNNLNEELQKNTSYNTFCGTNNYTLEKSALYYFDTINKFLCSKDDIFKNNSPIFLTFVNNFNEQLVLKQINNSTNDVKFQIRLITILQEIGNIHSIKYGSNEILEFSSEKFNKKFYFFVKNAVFGMAFSYNEIILAINTQNGRLKAVANDEGFQNAQISAGKKELANFYVNFNELNKLKQDSNFNAQLADLLSVNLMSGWVEYDFTASYKKLSLNGIINPCNYNAFSDFILNQNPNENTFTEILPVSTSAFVSMSLTDKKSFSYYIDSVVRKDTICPQLIKCEKLFSASKIDVKTKIRELVLSEICLVINNIEPTDPYNEVFVIANVKSNSYACDEFRLMFEKYCRANRLYLKDFVDSLEIAQDIFIPYFKLPTNNIPELTFGQFFKNCNANYVCFFNNFMLFGSSKKTIQKFAYDAILQNTLKNSSSYNEFANEFSQKSNFFAYFSSRKAQNLLQSLISNQVTDTAHNISNLGCFGYQINKTNDLLYNVLSVSKEEVKKERPPVEWESKLDTTVLSKPFIVKNHIDNSKEILVQDKNFNLYLINNQGIILWKLPIQEAILGNVQQIDYFNNKKLQYLFSTSSKIFIIDRIGNFVDKYPILLRAKATAALTVINYENNVIRLIIPCADKKIYLYDLEGKIVSGWKFNTSENIIKTPIQHFVINQKDYIIAHDNYKIYILSRQGTERLIFRTKFQFSNNKIYLDNLSKNNKFLTTDDKGTVRIFNIITNKQDSLYFRDFTANHKFSIYDLNSDGKYEFIFVDENEISVYSYNKRLIFSRKFENNISKQISFYNFGFNKIYVGVVCEDEEQIYLLDKNGNIADGFPQIGITEFSITSGFYNKNKYNLLVGGNENYIYNYLLK